MKTILYCRVSKDDSAAASIETQRHELLEYCGKNNLEVAEVIEDDGVSGALPVEERPGGRRMLAAVRQGACEAVLVYKLDRLGREPFDVLGTMAFLKARRIEFISATQSFGEGSAGGLQKGMLAVFAGFEREQICERSMAGTARHVREGGWPGGPPPFGFAVEGARCTARLVPSEILVRVLGITEAELVRWIYRWVADDGLSTKAIAKRLNSMGVPVSRPIEGALPSIWHPGRVWRIVSNPIYKGVFVYGRHGGRAKQQEHAVPLLVDAELWQRANSRMQANRRVLAGDAKHLYPLAGLILCECGHTFCGSANPRKSGRVDRYYRCAGKQHAGLDASRTRCPSMNVRADDIEAQVWADIQEFLRQPTIVVEELVRQQQDISEQDMAPEIQLRLLRDALAAKDDERQQVIVLRAQNLITDDDLAKQLGRIGQQKAELEQQREEMETRQRRLVVLGQQMKSVEARLYSYQEVIDKSPAPEIRRNIMRDLTTQVRVTHVTVAGARIPQYEVDYLFTPDASSGEQVQAPLPLRRLATAYCLTLQHTLASRRAA